MRTWQTILELDAENARKAIEKFAETAATDPEYAMRWLGQGAAKARVTLQFAEIAMAPEAEGNVAVGIREALRILRCSPAEVADGFCTGQSTDQMTNALHQYELEARLSLWRRYHGATDE